jgi:hypothetical protein
VRCRAKRTVSHAGQDLRKRAGPTSTPRSGCYLTRAVLTRRGVGGLTARHFPIRRRCTDLVIGWIKRHFADHHWSRYVLIGYHRHHFFQSGGR